MGRPRTATRPDQAICRSARRAVPRVSAPIGSFRAHDARRRNMVMFQVSRRMLRALAIGLCLTIQPLLVPAASAQQQKPNILVIMGDDIGYWNISAYNRGQMGYRTPNIDRIRNEGATVHVHYRQPSCTAGRAAFITGQSPLRTGRLKVGLPAAKEGVSEKDPTIADLLKPQGYVTGQFGKNHLGDRNEFLPTVHGFDEFFGNLYHLNAEDEPENPDYPKHPATTPALARGASRNARIPAPSQRRAWRRSTRNSWAPRSISSSARTAT